MTNVQITTQIHAGRHGKPYRSMTAEVGGARILTDITGVSAVSFIEQAIEKIIATTIVGGGVADITITVPQDVVLTDGMQTHIADKFEADPVVNSVVWTG